MTLQKLYTCIAILFAFCSVAYSWNDIEKGPYLQNVGKYYITIMWETTYATESRVDYGITEDCDLFVEKAKEVKLHEVTLRPLRPNTRYYYEISYGFDTKTGSFKTAPNYNVPFNFVVYGDTQANPDIHTKIAKNMLKINPCLILHTGDLVSDGTKHSQWKSLFFEPLRDVIDHIPIFTCLGNHENNAKSYFNLFSLPNNESWYSFNYSNCHFTVLDTNKDYAKGGNQYKWLKDDLINANTKWKLVFFHHPPYSSGRYGSNLEVREILTPLFRRHGVDVVFCGHDHLYERSYPIGSAFRQNDGVVTYVVSSGGGNLYNFTPNNPWTDSIVKINNFCVVNIDGEKLNLTALNTDGKVIDKFTIVKEKGKYQQYVKKAIPYEQIEFERTFPDNITPPVFFLEKRGRTLVQGAVEIQNPFPYLIDVKIVWHHLNGWNLRPKQNSVKIDSEKTAKIPFIFYSPTLKNIWPTPKFSVIYDNGLRTGRITNHLRVLLPKELSCKKTNKSIEVDGRLKERFWTDASPANNFIQEDGSDLAKKQTIAKVARGKNAIYFALVCSEPDPKKLSADVDKRDGDLRNDEAVIVSIAPYATTESLHSRGDRIVYQFGVNCKGVEYDAKDGRKEWNGKWKSATRINGKDWTVEMAIPYSVLELPSSLKKGEKWKINFFRSTKVLAEKSEWSTTLSSPLSVERFGSLIVN